MKVFGPSLDNHWLKPTHIDKTENQLNSKFVSPKRLNVHLLLWTNSKFYTNFNCVNVSFFHSFEHFIYFQKTNKLVFQTVLNNSTERAIEMNSVKIIGTRIYINARSECTQCLTNTWCCYFVLSLRTLHMCNQSYMWILWFLLQWTMNFRTELTRLGSHFK